jgi:hypothetical protein
MKRTRLNDISTDFYPPMSPPIYPQLKDHVRDCWSALITALEHHLRMNATADFVAFHCVTKPVSGLLFRSFLPSPKFWTMAIVLLKTNPGEFVLYWSDSVDGVHRDMAPDGYYQLNIEDVTLRMNCSSPLYSEVDYRSGNLLSAPKPLASWL